MKISWEAAGATDVGRLRGGNEDDYRLDTASGVFLVADGMGGHAAGEVASGLVTRTVAETLIAAVEAGEPASDALPRAVALAHRQILDCCDDDPRTRGMGTTLTCAVLESDGSCSVAHIGDSRLYLLRDGGLAQVTHDHTWVQQEVDAGRLAGSKARRHALSHILTRVLTDDLEPNADFLKTRVAPGDTLLLCTDGLYNMLPDDVIAGLLGDDPGVAVRALIERANAAGGADNITVVIVRVLEG